MRSVTSYFNATIIRTDIRRYWPLLFLYTGIWVVMLPVVQWVELKAYPQTDSTGYLYNMMFAGMIMALIFCGLFAMAVFSYTMNSRSIGLMHALPVRRGGQFLSHVAAVMGMLTGGKLLVAILTVLVQLLLGTVSMRAVAEWFVVVTLLEFFFLSLAILCSMVTGWLLAVPVLYAAANCVVILVNMLFFALGELFYFGYSQGGTYPAITRWLTPLYVMGDTLSKAAQGVEVIREDVGGAYVARNTEYGYALTPEVTKMLMVYTAAALVMLALSYWLYTRRASESAGDPVAFPAMRPLFSYTVALLGGLSMGMGLYAILSLSSSDTQLPLLMVCMVLMGALSYFAVEMVVRKSFRVWRKSWPGSIVVGVLLILLCVGASVDITGYKKRVPASDDVEQAVIFVRDADVYAGECMEEETLDAIIALHQAIVTEGREADEDETTYFVRFEYRMKDGSRMHRRYPLAREDIVQSAAITDALETVVNMEEVRRSAVLNGRPGSDIKFRGGYISGKYDESVYQLNGEEATRVYSTVLADLADGAGYRDPLAEERWQSTVYIELESENDRVFISNLPHDFEKTIALLEELGFDRDELYEKEEDYYYYD